MVRSWSPSRSHWSLFLFDRPFWVLITLISNWEINAGSSGNVILEITFVKMAVWLSVIFGQKTELVGGHCLQKVLTNNPIGCFIPIPSHLMRYDLSLLQNKRSQSRARLIKLSKTEFVALKGWNVCKYQHYTKAGRGRWLHYLILHQINKIHVEMDIDDRTWPTSTHLLQIFWLTTVDFYVPTVTFWE